MRLLHGLLHLFFPELCACCRSVLTGRERVLCLGCGLALERIPDPSDEAAQRLAGRFPFEQAFAYRPFVQDGLLQSALHQLKYHRRQDVGAWLGQQLGEVVLRRQADSGIGLVVPVPLHWKKEDRRGYNQAAVIAGGVGQALGLPVDPTLLRRLRQTGSQTRRGRADRLSNMEGVFACHREPASAHVLLVDDVLTTGATLEACALQLLRHPGVRVSVATAGIAAG